MAEWESQPPSIYSVVTGFFPEAQPKATWETNPRPLLVCGTAQHKETGMYFCRIAYGTSQHLSKGHKNDLVIGNVSMLDSLELKKPTRFVINSGKYMAIMPWIPEFFQPWGGFSTPVLSVLPEDMQKHVGFVLSELHDLPQF